MASPLSSMSERRSASEFKVSDYIQGTRRYYDSKLSAHVIKLFSGDWYVSTREDEMLSTILGSCISACIRDPYSRVGGMNHFLLPGDETMDAAASDAARYGVFAMETLINGIMKAGGQKSRLEIKVFGGGNVTNNTAQIGSKNAQFILRFLEKEGYQIASRDLEGTFPRSLHFYPLSGKVMMRKLHRKEDFVIAESEETYRRSISKQPVEGHIELF